MARLFQLALPFLIAIAAGCGGNPAQPTAPVVPNPGPNPSQEKPVVERTPQQIRDLAEKQAWELAHKEETETEAAIAPYIKKGQESYPIGKKAYVEGLNPGHSFVVLARLKDDTGASERVFVKVTGIADGRVNGSIVSPVRFVKGFQLGGEHSLAETEVLDWLIVSPSGRCEPGNGNAVGNFLEEREKTRAAK